MYLKLNGICWLSWCFSSAQAEPLFGSCYNALDKGKWGLHCGLSSAYSVKPFILQKINLENKYYYFFPLSICYSKWKKSSIFMLYCERLLNTGSAHKGHQQYLWCSDVLHSRDARPNDAQKINPDRPGYRLFFRSEEQSRASHVG